MPKFGKIWFNGGYFSDDVLAPTLFRQSIRRIPLGFYVHKQLGKRLIFQTTVGNGYYGSVLVVRYQQKKKYKVPSSINNSEGESYRRQWIASVEKWQYDLTDSQKALYNKRATQSLHMSGYNLFMREAMKGEVQMYVDRGDPSSYDYAKEDLTIDGAWHDMDLSGIVPAGAKAVFIIGHLQGNGADWTIMFRKKGNVNEVNHGGMETLRANVERHRSSIIALDTNRVIQYKVDNQAWTTLDLAVRGWWT